MSLKIEIKHLVLLIATLPIFATGEQIPPTQNIPQTKLIECIESIARGNVASARVNVAYDAAENKIRIFTIVSGDKKVVKSFSGYSVEIIYDRNIAKEAKVGVAAYPFQHNSRVLTFAAAQFALGNKKLGLNIVELLSAAQPDLFWSTPSHAAMTIKEIVVGLKNDDKSIKEFLDDQLKSWTNEL